MVIVMNKKEFFFIEKIFTYYIFYIKKLPLCQKIHKVLLRNVLKFKWVPL